MSDFWAFIIYFFAAVFIAAFMIIFSHFIGERHKGRFRDEPFESGMPLTGDARSRYSVHYYIIAMFFVIFDLDAIFLITYSVAFKEVGWMGYLGMSFFVLLLLVVMLYELKTGAFDFGPQGKKILKYLPKNSITEESMKEKK